MEAPDKIYVHRTIHLGFLSASEIDITGQDEQYIRKDALLEKIDDAIAHLSDGSLTGYYESLAYKDIRELIKSM